MVTADDRQRVNGIDVDELHGYIESVADAPEDADRRPVATARWLGGTRAEVVSTAGGPAVHMGGDEDPSAMNMLIRALAACDVEVVATKAALLGVEVEELSVEATGYFNIARLLGLDVAHGPGYQEISYVVRLKTRDASAEQLAAIRDACISASPVGDTLERAVPLELEFQGS